MAVQLQSELRVDSPKAIPQDIQPKKLSPEVTAAIRKDILILTSKIAASGGPELPVEQPAQTEPPQQQAPQEGTQNLQDAVGMDWSQYLELCMNNFWLGMQPAPVQTVHINWDVLMNWQPSPGKTLEENLQDLAACYQDLWRAITQNTSGAQQVELLARLDMIMMTKLEQLFSMDMMKLYDFLIANGEREAAQSIRPSIQRAGFALAHGGSRVDGGAQAPRTAAPTPSAAGEERGFAQAAVSGKAAAAGGPARSVFRQAESVPQTAAPERQITFLTPRELRQAGTFIRCLTPPRYESVRAPEQAALLETLDAGLLTLKAEVFFQNADLSPGFSGVMRRAMEQFLAAPQGWGSAVPDQQAVESRQAQSAPKAQAARASLLPRKAPQRPAAAEVAQRMTETFARTGSVRQAVLEGARLARILTSSEHGDLHRENEQLFWKAVLFGSGEAEGRKAPFQLIRENWNHFIRSMDFRRGKLGDLYFGAYESGGLQMPGQERGGAHSAITAAAMAVFLLIPPAVMLLTGHTALAAVLLGLDLGLGLALARFMRRKS